MLEDKRLIKTAKWSTSMFKDNGNYGVESFIQANSIGKSRRNKFGIINLRKFEKGKPIIWNGKFINPNKLNLGNLNLPKITTKNSN